MSRYVVRPAWSVGESYTSQIWRCNTLQRTATHCNTLKHIAAHFNTLQLTQIPSRESLAPHEATWGYCAILHHKSVLQCVAVRCSALQYVAVSPRVKSYITSLYDYLRKTVSLSLSLCPTSKLSSVPLCFVCISFLVFVGIGAVEVTKERKSHEHS